MRALGHDVDMAVQDQRFALGGFAAMAADHVEDIVVAGIDRGKARQMADLINVDLPTVNAQALFPHGLCHEILGRMLPAPARGELHQLGGKIHLFIKAGVNGILDPSGNGAVQHVFSSLTRHGSQDRANMPSGPV